MTIFKKTLFAFFIFFTPLAGWNTVYSEDFFGFYNIYEPPFFPYQSCDEDNKEYTDFLISYFDSGNIEYHPHWFTSVSNF